MTANIAFPRYSRIGAGAVNELPVPDRQPRSAAARY